MRWFLSVSVAAALAVGVATPARADVKMDEQTKKAVNRALEWLAARQNADGSWTEGRYGHNTAITAFTLLLVDFKDAGFVLQ